MTGFRWTVIYKIWGNRVVTRRNDESLDADSEFERSDTFSGRPKLGNLTLKFRLDKALNRHITTFCKELRRRCEFVK